MPKFQKIELVDSILTFRVICDDGYEETQKYALSNETENELMGRVAVHMNKERMAMVEQPSMEEVPSEPIMEVSVSKTGKISVKEAIEEAPVDETVV